MRPLVGRPVWMREDDEDDEVEMVLNTTSFARRFRRPLASLIPHIPLNISRHRQLQRRRVLWRSGILCLKFFYMQARVPTFSTLFLAHTLKMFTGPHRDLPAWGAPGTL